MKRFITVTLILLIGNVGLMAYDEEAQSFDGDEVFDTDTFTDEAYNEEDKSGGNAEAAAESGARAEPSGEADPLTAQQTESAQSNGQSADSAASENKHERKVYVTAAIGTAGFINLENRNTPYSMQYGYVMTINPFVNGRLVGELTTDFNSAVLAAVECGAEILIGGNGTITPFFGSGLGLAAARGEGNSGAGVTMSTSGGVYLFRTDVYQVNLQGRLLGLLSPIDGKYPFSYSVKIGVMF